MREPSLKESAIASVLIHALLFFFSLTVIKKSHYLNPYKTYTVKLVSPSKQIKHPAKSKTSKKTQTQKSTGVADIKKIKRIKAQRRKRMMSLKKSYKAKKKELKKTYKAEKKKSYNRKDEAIDTSHVQEEIEKLRALSRVKRLKKLKHQVFSISKKGGGSKKAVTSSSDSGKKAVGLNAPVLRAYIELAQRLIWNEWALPEIKDIEGLETIVIIKIEKDGKIKILGMEKSSGDSLYDRSALRAIMKASPLPPPPEEMEIGIRFRP